MTEVLRPDRPELGPAGSNTAGQADSAGENAPIVTLYAVYDTWCNQRFPDIDFMSQADRPQLARETRIFLRELAANVGRQLPSGLVGSKLTEYYSLHPPGAAGRVQAARLAETRQRYRDVLQRRAHQFQEIPMALYLTRGLKTRNRHIAAEAVQDLLTAYGMSLEYLEQVAAGRYQRGG